ncbi:MAG: hypothetical protein NT027_13490 [Proteobacteria bacterium]|nr:hypothetical protein [Pseudomonadota bacterium]
MKLSKMYFSLTVGFVMLSTVALGQTKVTTTPTAETPSIEDIVSIDFPQTFPVNARQISCSCKVMAGNSAYTWITVSCKGPSAKDCETCCETSGRVIFGSKPTE